MAKKRKSGRKNRKPTQDLAAAGVVDQDAAAADPAAGEMLRPFDPRNRVMLVAEDRRAVELRDRYFHQIAADSYCECRYEDRRPYMYRADEIVGTPQPGVFGWQEIFFKFERQFKCQGQIYQDEKCFLVALPCFQEHRDLYRYNPGQTRIGRYAAFNSLCELESRIRDFAHAIFSWEDKDRAYSLERVDEVFFVIDADPKNGLMRNKDILYALLELLHVLREKKSPPTISLIINNIDCLTKYAPKISDSDCPKDLTISGEDQQNTPPTLRRALAEFFEHAGLTYTHLNIGCLTERDGVPFFRTLVKASIPIKDSASAYPDPECLDPRRPFRGRCQEIAYLKQDAQPSLVIMQPSEAEQEKARVEVALYKNAEGRRTKIRALRAKVFNQLYGQAEKKLLEVAEAEEYCILQLVRRYTAAKSQVAELLGRAAGVGQQELARRREIHTILEEAQRQIKTDLPTLLEKIYNKLLQAIKPELQALYTESQELRTELQADRALDLLLIKQVTSSETSEQFRQMLKELDAKRELEEMTLLDGVPRDAEEEKFLMRPMVKELQEKAKLREDLRLRLDQLREEAKRLKRRIENQELAKRIATERKTPQEEKKEAQRLAEKQAAEAKMTRTQREERKLLSELEQREEKQLQEKAAEEKEWMTIALTRHDRGSAGEQQLVNLILARLPSTYAGEETLILEELGRLHESSREEEPPIADIAADVPTHITEESRIFEELVRRQRLAIEKMEPRRERGPYRKETAEQKLRELMYTIRPDLAKECMAAQKKIELAEIELIKERSREEEQRRQERQPSALTAAAVTLFAAADAAPREQTVPFPGDSAFFSGKLREYLKNEFADNKRLEVHLFDHDFGCLQPSNMNDLRRQFMEKLLHAIQETDNLNKPLCWMMGSSHSMIIGVPVHISGLPKKMNTDQVFDLCELQQRPGFDTGKFEHDGKVYDVASIAPAPQYCTLLTQRILEILIQLIKSLQQQPQCIFH